MCRKASSLPEITRRRRRSRRSREMISFTLPASNLCLQCIELTHRRPTDSEEESEERSTTNHQGESGPLLGLQPTTLPKQLHKMTRGNQRELARAKNAKKQGADSSKKKKEEDGLSAAARKTRDAEVMRQKQKKAGEGGGKGPEETTTTTMTK